MQYKITIGKCSRSIRGEILLLVLLCDFISLEITFYFGVEIIIYKLKNPIE